MFVLPLYIVGGWTSRIHQRLHSFPERGADLTLYGDSGVPELEDLRHVQTKGGWFETTVAGVVAFRRDKILYSLVTNPKNSSRVNVIWPQQDVLTMDLRTWNTELPHAVWVAVLWDAVSQKFAGEGMDLSAYDTTFLANTLYSTLLGEPGMRLQPCTSLDVNDEVRTLYGASFNTPQGPETRMISIFNWVDSDSFSMISPQYPGVRLDTITIGKNLVLDPGGQCMQLWSEVY